MDKELTLMLPLAEGYGQKKRIGKNQVGGRVLKKKDLCFFLKFRKIWLLTLKLEEMLDYTSIIEIHLLN